MAAQNQRQYSAKNLSGPSLKAFFAIVDRWQLSVDEACRLMGDPPRNEFAYWYTNAENVVLDELQIKRVSYLLAIYNVLKNYLPSGHSSLAWVRRPNHDFFFGGKSPLDHMLKGGVEQLHEVLYHIS